jgi:mRNA interferase MazF
VSARRGEIWLVDFGPSVGREQAGVRPAVIVSADPLNDGPSGVIIVVPLTSSRRGLPSHVEVEPGLSGLDEISYAKGEDVKSISDLRLVTRLGQVSADVLFDLDRVLRYLLSL